VANTSRQHSYQSGPYHILDTFVRLVGETHGIMLAQQVVCRGVHQHIDYSVDVELSGASTSCEHWFILL